MLISDELIIPHEKLADWIALLVAAAAYVAWSAAALVGFRSFVRRTRMQVLGTTIAVTILIAGLAVYGLIFLAVHGAAFKAAAGAAFPGALSPSSERHLLELVSDRGRAFITTPWFAGLRGVAFYTLPFVGLAAVLIARRRHVVTAG